MKKPNDYEAVESQLDYIPVELGGHHMVIKQVKETKSSTGKDMLVVCFDFAKNDKQAGCFMDAFQKDIRPEKKWPYQATQYIVTEDNDGKATRNLAAFIRSFEKSNNCKCMWVEGDEFCKQFKNKKIGGVFGIVEEEYNGERKKRTRMRWFIEDAKVEDAAVPDEKLLAPVQPAVQASDNDFVNVPDSAEEEIPF